jgi:hypothetical protein
MGYAVSPLPALSVARQPARDLPRFERKALATAKGYVNKGRWLPVKAAISVIKTRAWSPVPPTPIVSKAIGARKPIDALSNSTTDRRVPVPKLASPTIVSMEPAATRLAKMVTVRQERAKPPPMVALVEPLVMAEPLTSTVHLETTTMGVVAGWWEHRKQALG